MKILFTGFQLQLLSFLIVSPMASCFTELGGAVWFTIVIGTGLAAFCLQRIQTQTQPAPVRQPIIRSRHILTGIARV